ncbi:MAG: hypothetical protein JRD68_09260 [Deltaproteobacteria bacterium]|nr:hypothetical protein [Deltaproteobacteria bacterium]
MAEQRVIDRLPAFYSKFLPRFFERPIPVETMATCGDCAMWPEAERSFSEKISFNKATKCCTHYPNLPNYLVGALLSSIDPAHQEGKDRVLEKIHRRLGVTPQGILRPEHYSLVIKNTPDVFGKSKSLVCPYFQQDEGRCAIWNFNTANCNTWFCKYNAGEDGRLFWKALKEYLSDVQHTLTEYTQFKLGLAPGKIMLSAAAGQSITPDELDNEPLDEKSYQNLWGDWGPRVEDFYKEAYQQVASLTKRDFGNIAGISQKILLKNLEDKQRRLVKPDLPQVLTRNPRLFVTKTGDDSYTLVSYSPFDPIQVPKKIYDALDFFDGRRKNSEVRRLIARESGMELETDLLLSLYQLRILGEKES